MCKEDTWNDEQVDRQLITFPKIIPGVIYSGTKSSKHPDYYRWMVLKTIWQSPILNKWSKQVGEKKNILDKKTKKLQREQSIE